MSTLTRVEASGVRVLGAAVLVWGLAACQADAPADPLVDLPLRPEIAISRAPFTDIAVDFKQTFNEAYVYLDGLRGEGDVGPAMTRLMEAVGAQGLEPIGPVFATWGPSAGGDGPVMVGVAVASEAGVTPPLKLARTGEQLVAYAVVEGPFGASAQALPAIQRYLGEHGWMQAGPRREYYARDASAGGPGAFLTEVQLPWAQAR